MATKKSKPTEDGRPHCETCCYWIRLPSDTHTDNQDGDCRRYPPQLLHDPEDGTYAVWPITETTDYCGEYRQRLNA